MAKSPCLVLGDWILGRLTGFLMFMLQVSSSFSNKPLFSLFLTLSSDSRTLLGIRKHPTGSPGPLPGTVLRVPMNCCQFLLGVSLGLALGGSDPPGLRRGGMMLFEPAG